MQAACITLQFLASTAEVFLTSMTSAAKKMTILAANSVEIWTCDDASALASHQNSRGTHAITHLADLRLMQSFHCRFMFFIFEKTYVSHFIPPCCFLLLLLLLLQSTVLESEVKSFYLTCFPYLQSTEATTVLPDQIAAQFLPVAS